MSTHSNLFRKSLLGASAAIAALAALVVPAVAQSSGGQIEEITVTAERRSTNLQTTPLAITAISSDDLAKSNIVQVADLNGVVPGTEITKSAGFETIVTIRGVGLETPENSLTTSPGVALFEDGAYVSNTVSLDQTLFDIDHIEVLRGPQGALYGESATGGAILLVTKQPDLNGFSGTADVDLGTYDLHRESLAVNIPVTDDFAIRVSGQQIYHDGFTKDTIGHPLDDANDLSGKFAAMWQPLSNFTATLTTEFYHANQDAAAQKNIHDPNSDPWTVTQDFEPKFDMATNLTHLNVEWDEPTFAIKSVTAYQWLDNVQGEDSSRSAASILGTWDDVVAWDTSLQNYNEEFDIQSRGDTNFDWTVGMFLLSQKGSQFVAEFECYFYPCSAATPSQLAILPTIQSNPYLAYGNITEVLRKSWAFFADTTYHINNQFSVSLGGRMNADTYTDRGENFGGAFFGGPSANPYVHSSSDHVGTWSAQLNYQMTPDNLLYLSSNRGYKPGGVNGEYGQSYQCTSPFTFGGCNPSEPLVVPNQFKPETNTAFELGSKNSWFDNHLQADLAGFYYIYHDMQYIATDPVPFDGGMTNIPSTHIYGAEAEVSYIGLDDRLHANGDLSLENGAIQNNYKAIDSTVANQIESTSPACAFSAQYYYPGCWYTVLAGAKDVGGNAPAKMPKVLGSFNVAYDIPVWAGTFTPRVEYVYRGPFWARIFDEPALDRVPGYSLVNLNFDYVPDNSNFKVSLLVSNLGDVAGVNSRYTDPYGTGQTSQQFIPPRQVIGSISYNF